MNKGKIIRILESKKEKSDNNTSFLLSHLETMARDKRFSQKLTKTLKWKNVETETKESEELKKIVVMFSSKKRKRKLNL